MIPVFERFPHDIFKEIMLHTYVYTLESHGEAEFDIAVLSPPIPASHVCRSWRRALLSDSTMWTCLIIPGMSCKWIMELLHRSDSSLLNVFLGMYTNQFNTYGTSYDETLNMLSALFHQMHRFKLLCVHIHVWGSRPTSPPGFIEVLIQQVVSHLQRPAPKLRAFSFWCEYLDGDPDYGHDYTVIKRLFSADAPVLKRIHHRLSRDVQELDCPVFHGLSELRLTLSFDYGFDFDRFLDLLASSPGLKLLHLDVVFVGWPDSEQPSHRRVALSFLEKLRLDVHYMVELTGFVLEYATFPLNLVWHIASRPIADFKESPPVSRFLTRAHFTSLYITTLPSFAELSFQEILNNNHINRYVYIYDDVEDLKELWDMVMHAFKFSSCITHMELELGNLSDFYRIFQTFLALMLSLKSLVIRPKLPFCASDAEEVRLVRLAALRSNPQALKEALDNNNANATIENLKLDLKPTGFDLEDTITPHDSKTPTSTIPVFPCPLLREVTVELHDPLKTQHAKVLCACSDLRQNGGYPFQIHVRCPQIEQRVEEILGLRKNNTIEISSPFYVEKKLFQVI